MYAIIISLNLVESFNDIMSEVNVIKGNTYGQVSPPHTRGLLVSGIQV